MSSIVCIVIHPSRVIREGLKRMLATSPFEPACTVSGIADVPSIIADAGEQVLVLIGAREERGLVEDLNAVKASFPDAHVVVVGDANQLDLVAVALGLGATSFVDESVATSSLIKELELVGQGEPVISVLIVKRLLGHISSPPSEQAVTIRAVDEQPPPETQGLTQQKSQLSSREAAILGGLVQGASNKTIACQLKITEATVKVHVKAILRKIRVRNRTQAAIWALKCQGAPKRLSAEGDASPLGPA
jgi:two-component system, NarL family, nitrate/nitrite response regulator NarL